MSPDPTLPIADGSGSLGRVADPILVDPSPSLLRAAVQAYREAAPALVDPVLATLRTDASSGGDSVAAAADLPALTVLATDGVVDAVVERFHAASRLAALAEAGVCDLRTLPEPQPNAVLAGRSSGFVLVASPSDDDGGPWRPVGDDPTLRERYDQLVAAADVRRLRTPSRRRIHDAFRERSDSDLADDVIRALDADRHAEDVDRRASEDAAAAAADATLDGVSLPDAPLDLAGARFRAYVVGTHRGALDRDLRRACEDAGLGSRATFTRIKRELREVGLLGTESVSQPVGRPRERLVARGALADADGPVAAVAAALDATG
ncbi:DUF5821 family protein [Halorubrum sp. AD140]|uniref:transcriptional regulator TbsP domain-containing protein n=1 Tax=Halorubrum sp. AD140 TaxID=3050073 RepID=UPI002ACCE43A|nr:DUF5821 family protein [Halorubrum sp. AD140]MDZ5810950.1 DUF5821 family protein [Halorubrum sp. AD140]